MTNIIYRFFTAPASSAESVQTDKNGVLGQSARKFTDDDFPIVLDSGTPDLGPGQATAGMTEKR